MTGSQIIVLATPVFLLLIGLEIVVGHRRGQRVYRSNDAISSISLGVLSQLSGLFTKALAIGIYTLTYDSLALVHADAFWKSVGGFVLALVFYDFCYYWYHRAGHEVAILWAAHVVHHQSQAYNLSTALRQTSSGALLGWIFYLPMALAGVPPLVFGIVALVDLLYQFWVHTELVGKLGWFDRVFCAPSNHRVHHAVNDHYVDRNYGGILIVWDRLFGSFREEDERCVYGTRGELRSWDPLWANAEVYGALLRDAWRTRRWTDKLRVFLKPPGWRPADVAERWPKPPFALAQVWTYDPPISTRLTGFAVLEFLVLLGAVAWVLWQAGVQHGSAETAVWSATLVAAFWALGAMMQGRLSWLAALCLQTAALATASSALGMGTAYAVLKPLTMVLALAIVLLQGTATQAPAADPQASRIGTWLLAGGIAASLVGDVLLLLPSLFIPGLVAFLVAHLFYIALLRQRVGWLPSRAAVLVTLVFGAAMLGYLWAHLGGGVLKAAVTVYVLVIALMAAQAIGRAAVLRDTHAIAVAVGACFFMASDSLLAINRFVAPLPFAGVWVLATYYTAQLLIVLHVMRSAAARQMAASDASTEPSAPAAST